MCGHSRRFWRTQVAAAVLLGKAACLELSLTDYGAEGGAEGLLAATNAFRRALAELTEAGGGRLVIPPGVWHVGPVNLTSNLVLWLSEGAVLVADTDRSRLPVLPAIASWGPNLSPREVQRQGHLRPQADLRDAIPRYQPLLWGNQVTNVSIMGANGTLDGRGADWWTRWLHEPLLGRPHVIQFQESQGILLRNVTIRNPGFWTVHLWNCEHVTVQHVTILVEPWDPPVRPTNTDGINPDSSRHVLIEDSYFQTGDDAVAVKSGWDCFGRRLSAASENITIRRVAVRQTRGCNAAAFTIGSEMSGGVQDVSIEDCHVINAGVAVEIKVGSSRGGFVRRVRTRDLEVGATSRGGLVVMASYPENNPFCSGRQPPPSVSDLSFDDIRVRGPSQGALVQFLGTPEVFMNNITVNGLEAAFGFWACNDQISGIAKSCRPPPCAKLRDRSGRPAAVPRGWRNDGRCGAQYPVRGGLPGRCPTPTEFAAEAASEERRDVEPFLRNAPCCSSTGWCGNELEHCQCMGCMDFRRATRRAEPSVFSERGRLAVRRDRTTTVHLLKIPAVISKHAKTSTEAKPSKKPSANYEVNAALWSVALFVCIFLVRRVVPGASKHWLCRTPHVCVCSLIFVSSLQCLLLAWRYSRDPLETAVDVPATEAIQHVAATHAPVQVARQSEVEPSAPTAEPRMTTAAQKACQAIVTPWDFGARGNGLTDDSEAVRSALLEASRCRSEVVFARSGPGAARKPRFLVWPNALELTLEDVVITLHGVLVGPSLEAWNPRHEVWPKGSCAYGEADCKSGGPSPEFARSQWSLLLLRNSRNVTISGRGGIRGGGTSFWRVRNTQPQVRGYCLLKLDQSEDVSVSGIRLVDSPMYQVVVARSQRIQLQGLYISLNHMRLGDDGAHNTDGVSIIASQHVLLQDSVIESGDDNVVVKEGSHDIACSGLLLRRGKGVSIGSLGERGAEDQVVTNISFYNVTLDQSMHGARIKTWKGAHGLVRNVTFSMFKTLKVTTGILIDQMYCPPSQRPEGCASGPSDAIRIEDVRFLNFVGTFLQQDRKVQCSTCSGITYEGISLHPAMPENRWPPRR